MLVYANKEERPIIMKIMTKTIKGLNAFLFVSNKTWKLYGQFGQNVHNDILEIINNS